MVPPRAGQTISFPAPTGVKVGDPDFDPGAIASSGLPVTYTSQTTSVCTIVSGKVHLLAAGECKVTAEQAGDSDYNPAPSVQRSFTVAPAEEPTQPKRRCPSIPITSSTPLEKACSKGR
ncbi:MAG TPA: hypothetical protein VG448_02145 [Solirubrobacterales bacterium]|nr:hypothetical protein [Solirubrobacterales bacterium]